jgi:hypothetical protein
MEEHLLLDLEQKYAQLHAVLVRIVARLLNED